jgi:hypothetical protein
MVDKLACSGTLRVWHTMSITNMWSAPPCLLASWQKNVFKCYEPMRFYAFRFGLCSCSIVLHHGTFCRTQWLLLLPEGGAGAQTRVPSLPSSFPFGLSAQVRARLCWELSQFVFNISQNENVCLVVWQRTLILSARYACAESLVALNDTSQSSGCTSCVAFINIYNIITQ